MKRITAIGLSLLLTLALLAGCGAAAEPRCQASETTAAPTAEPAAAPTAAEPVTVRLGALTGPTAMGMVKLFDGADAGETENAYTYTLAGSADELTPKILQGEVDIAAVPANLAAVLYNKTQGGVEMLAVNTLGVLYVVEKGERTVESFADLRGQTLYATGKGATPEYFLRYLLAESGLDPDKDVTIEWKSEPAEVVTLMSTMDRALALLPQPYVTVAQSALGEQAQVVLSLSEAWDRLDNGSRCITAGLIVRREFAQENPQAVDAFLREYFDSADWVNQNPAEAGALCERYGVVKAAVAEKAIPYCNIVCITGAEMKDALTGCLEVLYGQNPAAVGGALPGDDFWYGA